MKREDRLGFLVPANSGEIPRAGEGTNEEEFSNPQ